MSLPMSPVRRVRRVLQGLAADLPRLVRVALEPALDGAHHRVVAAVAVGLLRVEVLAAGAQGRERDVLARLLLRVLGRFALARREQAVGVDLGEDAVALVGLRGDGRRRLQPRRQRRQLLHLRIGQTGARRRPLQGGEPLELSVREAGSRRVGHRSSTHRPSTLTYVLSPTVRRCDWPWPGSVAPPRSTPTRGSGALGRDLA